MGRQHGVAGESVALVVRRLGSRPVERGCDTQATCPDVFELTSGDFLVIGAERAAADVCDLPEDAGCGVGERIVAVPREVLLASLRQLAAELGSGF